MRQAPAALALALVSLAALGARAFEPREDAAFERGYYVSADLADAIRELDGALSSQEKKRILEGPREAFLVQQKGQPGGLDSQQLAPR